ncbi:hypothetical protein RJ641_035806 [Dillenia turbinata]|uniref:tRNA-binding domain-containing protein n=1 Tax=Dillenia turbinata TaxID=194707 RepID=A0AAN8ZCL8_9MAGN
MTIEEAGSKPCPSLSRQEMIVTSLCKRFSLDPKVFLHNTAQNDTKSLYLNILNSSGASLQNTDEVTKWLEFSESFPVDSEACFGALKELNNDLAHKSVLLGDGLKPSEADVVVFSIIHSFVFGLSKRDTQKFPNVMRWMDYIQNKEGLGGLFENILLEKTAFEPPAMKSVAKVDSDSNAKKTQQSKKGAGGTEVDPLKTSPPVNNVAKDAEAVAQKKLPDKDAAEKDKEVSVNLLNIQVGLIRKAWKHPSADSLLVEEIDIGDSKLRQVVSGLAKYCTPNELMKRRVVLITNVKPGKLRDVMSEGLVLCASNEDHTAVEPLLPPEGAKLGERVSFSGHEGNPEEVLNPKKKQLEKITPHLYTDDNGVATFKGIPFMTSGGPCTSSLLKASIK